MTKCKASTKLAAVKGLINGISGIHLKYGNPGEADVVERDGAFERVVADRTAVGVELVPVDALVGRSWVVRRPVARSTGDRVCVYGQVGALGHTVVMRLTADEVAPASVIIRRQIQPERRRRICDYTGGFKIPR